MMCLSLDYFLKFAFYCYFCTGANMRQGGRNPDSSLGRGVLPMLATEEMHIGAPASAPQPIGFSGGSYDTSLLVKYDIYGSVR